VNHPVSSSRAYRASHFHGPSGVRWVRTRLRTHGPSGVRWVRTRLRTRFAPAWALRTPGRGGYPEVSLRRGQLVNHPVSSSRAYRASHFHGPSGVRWARGLGLQLYARSAATEDDLDAAFAAFADRRVDAVLVGTSPRLFVWQMRIVGLAARTSLPAALTAILPPAARNLNAERAFPLRHNDLAYRSRCGKRESRLGNPPNP
jgi:hypothetical protein